jgi:hypothetical protein
VMLLRNDVVDLERQIVERLRHPAVLAAPAGPTQHELPESVVHASVSGSAERVSIVVAPWT